MFDKFWLGQAVLFNNPVWASSGNADSFALVITVYVTASAVTTSQSFRFRIRMDETLNQCEENDGCPWTSPWWANNPAADTRPDCPIASTPRISATDTKCCRYYTLSNLPCADRVWTLDFLDSTKSIPVDGANYTLSIAGFTITGRSGATEEKDYFIAQERSPTAASMYARLVTACPSISNCASGQLVVVGNACQCLCDGTCPAGAIRWQF